MVEPLRVWVATHILVATNVNTAPIANFCTFVNITGGTLGAAQPTAPIT